MNGKLLTVLLLCFILSNVSTQKYLDTKFIMFKGQRRAPYLICRCVVQNNLQTNGNLK